MIQLALPTTRKMKIRPSKKIFVLFINIIDFYFLKRFTSVKTGRGPLTGADWVKTAKPMMTCYKLVTCEFKWFGLQGRIENFILKSEHRLFTTFHR